MAAEEVAPDKRRGGPLATDRPNVTAKRQPAEGTPPLRRRGRTARHVLAEAVLVVGDTGRERWLLVLRCPLCADRHVAHGRSPLPDTLERKAACGRGWLVVHPYGMEAVA